MKKDKKQCCSNCKKIRKKEDKDVYAFAKPVCERCFHNLTYRNKLKIQKIIRNWIKIKL